MLYCICCPCILLHVILVKEYVFFICLDANLPHFYLILMIITEHVSFHFQAILILQILGWVFLPVYLAGGVFTMPDYLKRRFGGQRIQMYIAFLSLLLYIFTKISVSFYFCFPSLGLFLAPVITQDNVLHF